MTDVLTPTERRDGYVALLTLRRALEERSDLRRRVARLVGVTAEILAASNAAGVCLLCGHSEETEDGLVVAHAELPLDSGGGPCPLALIQPEDLR